jgi:hypothetical protein
MPEQDTSTSTLLVIDVQQGLASPSPGIRNNPRVNLVSLDGEFCTIRSTAEILDKII